MAGKRKRSPKTASRNITPAGPAAKVRSTTAAKVVPSRPMRKASATAAKPVDGTIAITPLLERAASGKDTLDQLLEAWRLVPAAEIADAIERVPREDLAAVVTGTAVDGLARLTRVDHSRDPRASATFVRWLADPPWHATGSKPFYKALFARLLDQADPRAVAELPKAAKALAKVVNGKSMRGWLVEQIAKSAEALAERTTGIPSLAAKDRGLVARAGKIVATAPRSAPKVSTATAAAAELLAAIHADPSDDGARQVYADVLSAKQDPRGEFITMQLARAGREPTPEERKRELVMLRKHIRVWLAEFASVIGGLNEWNIEIGPARAGNIRFERGFLAGCALRGSEKKMTAIAGHPDLATVEDLIVFDQARMILEASALPALRDLAIHVDVVELALQRPFAKHLETVRLTARDGVDATFARAISACCGFPKLHTIKVDFPIVNLDAPAIDALRAALAITQLQTVRVSLNSCQGSYERTPAGWRFTTGAKRQPRKRPRRVFEALASAK